MTHSNLQQWQWRPLFTPMEGITCALHIQLTHETIPCGPRTSKELPEVIPHEKFTRKMPSLASQILSVSAICQIGATSPRFGHTHLVWSKIFYSERKACNITFPGKQKQETKTISNGKKLVKTTKTWWQSRKRQIRGSLALHPFGRIRRSETTEEIHGHLCEVDVAELDLDKWR